MDKKTIKLLAEKSYTNNKLDSKKVSAITKRLRISELKKYVKELKRIEKERTVTVVLPDVKINLKNLQKEFKNIFPDKKVAFETDPSMVVGLKVINNDMIYELSLNNAFNKIKSYIKDSYL